MVMLVRQLEKPAKMKDVNWGKSRETNEYYYITPEQRGTVRINLHANVHANVDIQIYTSVKIIYIYRLHMKLRTMSYKRIMLQARMHSLILGIHHV